MIGLMSFPDGKRVLAQSSGRNQRSVMNVEMIKLCPDLASYTLSKLYDL